MHLLPNETHDTLVLSLGSEEALVLLQPGKMLRSVLEQDTVWRSASRFLTSSDQNPGMLIVISRAAASALLTAPARHSIERDLKELLFRELSNSERPPLLLTPTP